MSKNIVIQSLNVFQTIKEQINRLALKPNRNNEFFCYLLPDNNVDLSAIPLDAKPFGNYHEQFENNARYV